MVFIPVPLFSKPTEIGIIIEIEGLLPNTLRRGSILTEHATVVIPVRGGSKGIANKNKINFAGRPLLAWSVLQAAASTQVTEIVVTSDDDELLAIARHYGATVIKRPDELATDEATSESALLHALDYLKKRDVEPNLVVFLQATSPLRKKADIDRAIDTFVESGADSLFSASLADDLCLWRLHEGELTPLTFDPANRKRRQDRQPLLLENGSIYIFRPELLRTNNNRIGGKIVTYEMESWQSLEIDSPDDVELIEHLFTSRLI